MLTVAFGIVVWIAASQHSAKVKAEQRAKSLESSNRVLQTGAAQYYQKALVAEGRLNQCLANF